MDKFNLDKRKSLLALGFFALILLLWWFEPGSLTGVKGRWFSMVPALVVVFVTLVTRRLFLGLFMSIAIGSLIAGVFQDPGALSAWGLSLNKLSGFFTGTISDQYNLQILAFIIFLFPTIQLMMRSGAMYGVIRPITKRLIKSPKSAQGMTVFMGFVIFIDDYANSMIVGNIMRPITDKFKVSREKLAFLVDATSAPVAGVALISTWVGYEVSLFSQVAKDLGVNMGGYEIFLAALNYRFYCYFMILFVILIVMYGRDFGPMARAERLSAEAKDDLTPGEESVAAKSLELANGGEVSIKGAKINPFGAIIPMLLLFGSFLVGVWMDGGGDQLGASGLDYFSFANWQQVFSNSENNILILAQSAALALVAAIILSLLLAKISFKDMAMSLWVGFKGTWIPLGILILAWTLKAVCNDLETGAFLVASTKGILAPEWLPMIVFVLGGIVAFTTGTSWGTMAILIPMVAPLAFHYDGGSLGVLSFMSLAAVLDGAIFGDHCSPISDTTVMSSMATDCDHIAHVTTQLPYALVVASLALFVGYLPTSLWNWSLTYSFLAAVTFMAALILIFGRKRISN